MQGSPPSQEVLRILGDITEELVQFAAWRGRVGSYLEFDPQRRFELPLRCPSVIARNDLSALPEPNLGQRLPRADKTAQKPHCDMSGS